jgi:hypothetical protein
VNKDQRIEQNGSLREHPEPSSGGKL